MAMMIELRMYVKLGMYRCSKLLHYVAIIGIKLLTFASPIRQKVPCGLIILWYKIFMVKTAYNKIADR